MRTVDLTAVERHPPIVESAPTADRRALWRSEDDTRAFAARLAAAPGIGEAFIALRGELGSGKTTLVRHLLQALGVTGRIKSPTYAVVEPHEAPAPAGSDATMPIWHFDFYRFGDPREWEDAGFRDIFAGPGLKLAEWPDQAGALLPAADLAVQLEVLADGQREVTLTAHTPLGRALLG